MDFKYLKFPRDSSNNPFPNDKSAIRPVIKIDFETNNGTFGYFVLIDSGSDYCIFHATIGSIPEKNYKELWDKIKKYDLTKTWLIDSISIFVHLGEDGFVLFKKYRL